VGTTDGRCERALVELGPLVVTGLAYDRAAGEKARAVLAEAGLDGRATVYDVLDHARLPLVDDSVALLVVESDAPGDRAPAADEITRCLRPGGLALVNRGTWRQLTKVRPNDIDDWTHFNYDASGSDTSRDERVGPMKSLRWLGGDPFQDDIVGMRTAAGVYVSIEQNHMGPVSTFPPEGAIVARDAFSGVVLWRRPGFYVRSRYGFVLDDKRV